MQAPSSNNLPNNALEFGNDFISRSLKKDEIFYAGRFGAIESTIISCIDYKRRCPFFIVKMHYKNKYRFEHAWNNAGIFPDTMKEFRKFWKYSILAIKNIDICGLWNNTEDFLLLQKYKSSCWLTHLDVFYMHKISHLAHPWTEYLKGKKVLVISPFTETIEKQYKKREHLYANKNILPKFTLITYKAYNTVTRDSISLGDWEKCLISMFNGIRAIDFDVALLGCGSYGMPLAGLIKSKLNKSAIHMGGGLQVLFGILGKRFESEQNFVSNKYWCRPSDDEKPKNYLTIEGGCYW